MHFLNETYVGLFMAPGWLIMLRAATSGRNEHPGPAAEHRLDVIDRRVPARSSPTPVGGAPLSRHSWLWRP